MSWPMENDAFASLNLSMSFHHFSLKNFLDCVHTSTENLTPTQILSILNVNAVM